MHFAVDHGIHNMRLAFIYFIHAADGDTGETAAEYAGTGVDYLAVGALTHSVRVLDIGLDV